MKSDTVLVFLKGLGLIGGNICFAYAGALGQWVNEGQWPSKLNWHIIVATTAGAGFTALVAFCSGSVSKWRADRANGNNVDTTPKPTEVKS